jgi:hypothetical protein
MNISEYFLHIAADNESKLQAKSSKEQTFSSV